MTSTFRQVDERELYRGSLITVARGTFAAPNGETFERDVVHHPGAVSVVALVGDIGDTGDRQRAPVEVLLVRQYRAAVDRVLLEIPAGKRDVADEPPVETAHRELIEEVGMRAGRLEPLAEFYNSPGFSDEHSFIYLAVDLAPTSTNAQGVEERHMTIERVPLGDTPALIRGGAIVDAKTIIGLTMAREALA